MYNKVNEDLMLAMKNSDKFTLSVLRMLKSALLLQLKQSITKTTLEDSEVISTIKKQVKMRKDSIEEFKKYNKLDEIDNLNKEIEVLTKYLPEELTEEEIRKIIDEVFLEVKPTSMKDMGNIMKALNLKIENADMSLVSKIVKEKLM